MFKVRTKEKNYGNIALTVMTTKTPAVLKITEWCFGVTSCPHVKSKKMMSQSQDQRHHLDLHLLGGGGVAHGPSRRHRGHRRLHRLPGEQDGEQHGEQHGLIDLLLGRSLVPSCAYKILPKWARIPLPVSRWKRIPTPSSKPSQCRATRTEHLATSRAAIQSSILVIISSRLLQFLFVHKLFWFKGSSAEPDLQLAWWSFYYWPNKLMALCHFRLMTPGSIAQHSNVSACLCLFMFSKVVLLIFCYICFHRPRSVAL